MNNVDKINAMPRERVLNYLKKAHPIRSRIWQRCDVSQEDLWNILEGVNAIRQPCVVLDNWDTIQVWTRLACYDLEIASFEDHEEGHHHVSVDGDVLQIEAGGRSGWLKVLSFIATCSELARDEEVLARDLAALNKATSQLVEALQRC